MRQFALTHPWMAFWIVMFGLFCVTQVAVSLASAIGFRRDGGQRSSHLE